MVADLFLVSCIQKIIGESKTLPLCSKQSMADSNSSLNVLLAVHLQIIPSVCPHQPSRGFVSLPFLSYGGSLLQCLVLPVYIMYGNCFFDDVSRKFSVVMLIGYFNTMYINMPVLMHHGNEKHKLERLQTE